jgi:hypothetical protein
MFCEGRCHEKYKYRLIPQQVLGKLYRKHECPSLHRRGERGAGG